MKKDLTSISYSESIEYLYSTTTFRIELPKQYNFYENWLPNRLLSITSVHVETSFAVLFDSRRASVDSYANAEWEELWQNLSKLPQLQSIRVDLFGPLRADVNFLCSLQNLRPHISNRDPRSDSAFLEPLKMVSRPLDFDVYLNWEITNVERLDDAPFRLHRGWTPLRRSYGPM